MQKSGADGYLAGCRPEWLDNDGCNVSIFIEQTLYTGAVIGVDYDRVGSDVGRHADGGAAVEMRDVAAGHVVQPTVIMPVKSHQFVLAGKGACQSHCHLSGFGARGMEAHAFRRRHHFTDFFSPENVEFMSRGEMCATRELRTGGRDDLRVIVAEQQGAVPAEVIDVFITIDIPLASTGGVAGVEPVGLGVA